MYEIKVCGDFSAAHQVRGYRGNCENLHGHNWHVEVLLKSNKLDDIGFVMDFRQVRYVLNEVLEGVDHNCLNELEYFQEVNPTSENIAKYIYDNLSRNSDLSDKLDSVRVWESADSSACYRLGDRV